jgi:creatinine amidohydrolase/Fe(II)-dependent formamide hydrolase-like protein
MTDTHDNQKSVHQLPLALSHLTFREIEQEIERLTAIIVPLGGCEPWAGFGSLGIAAAVAGALAGELSARTRILMAPVITYGCSTPFASFGGSAGVKPRTMTNMLCETIRMWFFQGFSTVFLIDALMENKEAVDAAVRRLKSSHPHTTIEVFAIQRDEGIRAFAAQLSPPGDELYRSEFGMLSLAAWIDPALVRPPHDQGRTAAGCTREQFKSWRKRGADPEQYRKRTPDCSSSSIAHHYNARAGQSIFEYILGIMEENVARVVRTRHP